MSRRWSDSFASRTVPNGSERDSVREALRYVPAVLADVVEVGQLAVGNLLGVMLEQRHPPNPVTGHSTGLHTHKHTQH